MYSRAGGTNGILDLGKQLARDWRNTWSIWHSRLEFLSVLFSLINPFSDIGLSLDKKGHLKMDALIIKKESTLEYLSLLFFD